ncbi:MAG: hypothetical protein OES47_00155, partial [Acidobacteriota bacterium]|nr:hypothetical protein [Acidobacteriota bacterium]
MRKKTTVSVLCLLGLLVLVGCSGHQALRAARQAELVGDWDQAVLKYLELSNRYPDRVEYRTGLLRSKIRASQGHFEKGKKFVEAGALERGFAEYQQAVQLDTTNQYAQIEMEKLREVLLRDEESRAAPGNLKDIKARNRGARAQPPELNPRSIEPISLEFPKPVSVFDIYKALGRAFGINVLFDPKLRDQQIAIELRDVVAQDALEILMRTASHFYKVVDEHSIIVVEDNPQNRRNYEDLVIQTFFLSNAETKDVLTMLRSLVGAKNIASSDQLNAIILRDTADKVKVAERIIDTIDKARGEVVVDVELLQINTSVLQDLGVRLSEYSVTQRLDQPEGGIRVSDLEFINQGNWFLNIPSFVYNFMKTSSEAELLASPQVRISDGETASLTIGDSVPIPVTSFNTSQTVGGNIVPLTSFQYRDVGIRVEIEPRIHHNREVTLKITVEVSNLGESIQAGTQEQPVIGTRNFESTIRLKNGETNFLAGLIRTDESRDQVGVPGLSDVPVLGRLFSNKGTDRRRTDLVLTLTPHIIRTADISEEDLLPIWVGTEANITFRGGSPRVESEVEGPFEREDETDAERIREMIRRRIQNLPRGLQNEDTEEEDKAPPGVDLTPAAAPSDPFRSDDDGEDEDDDGDRASLEPTSLIFVPSDRGISDEISVASLSAAADGEAVLTTPVRLRLAPASLQIGLGDELDVTLEIQSDEAVAHLPVTLGFDPRVLSVVQVSGGDFLDSQRSEILADTSAAGRLVLGASQLGEGGGVIG